MACQRRKKLGHCSHHQCEFTDYTDHGYECVEVIKEYCEMGSGCYEKCQYSWKEEDAETNSKALKAFLNFYDVNSNI